LRDFHFVEPLARRLIFTTSLIIILLMIALHLGLVDLGQWTFDDFSLITSYRDKGWMAFSDRLFGWSPRPISEALLWAYACFVNWTEKPLIGVFLCFLWLTLIVSPLFSFLQIREKNSPDSLRSPEFLALFAFGPIALFLLGHSPGELFYWPVGAAAYLTTLNAITLCFFQLAFNLTRCHRGRLITALALSVAAASSETGSFFAVAFGSLSLIWMFFDRRPDLVYQRKFLWCLIPALIGIGVFGLLVHNRVPAQEALFTTAEYHNPAVSLKSALGQTVKECLISGQRLSPRGLLLGLLLKACFFLGLRYCWLSSGIQVARRRVLMVLAISIIATVYFSVAASFYGYGGLTNSWHQELRQCLIVLLLATAALFSCHYHVQRVDLRGSQWLGGIFILITLLFVVPGRMRALIHDYRNYPAGIESRHQSWRSGLADENAMIWFSPPKYQVASTLIFEPGIYDLESKDPGPLNIMHFFHKERLEIRPDRWPAN
jgi:hypothetical protein